MEYNVKLIKENDNDILRFDIDSEVYDMNLNSEKQDDLIKLFYKIISLSFLDDISFKLDYSEHEPDLFKDIAEDYIAKLEIEIKTIRQSIPQELKSSGEWELLW